jgi:hypothetical protein
MLILPPWQPVRLYVHSCIKQKTYKSYRKHRDVWKTQKDGTNKLERNEKKTLKRGLWNIY